MNKTIEDIVMHNHKEIHTRIYKKFWSLELQISKMKKKELKI